MAKKKQAHGKWHLNWQIHILCCLNTCHILASEVSAFSVYSIQADMNFASNDPKVRQELRVTKNVELNQEK